MLDSENNYINASLQIFVYNSKNNLTKWSNVFSTEDHDYNYNAGNPDISGQENSLGLADSNGEYIVISAWADGSRDDINNIPTEFAYIVLERKGDELYIQNIKLNKPNPITCENWEAPASIIQGESILALNHNTNEMTYEAEGTTHYLFKKYDSEIIFPFMGTNTAQFNFNNEGFSNSNVYTPTTGGDTEIKIEVTDYFGTTVQCTKTTKVFYVVFPGFMDEDGTYILNEDILITSNPSGHTDKIVSAEYNFNGEIIQGENFTKTLEVLGNIDITQYITYFDAYENINIELNRIIAMENIPPELVIEAIKEPENELAKKDYEFAHNGTDIDGYIASVKWELFRNNPDINGNENWSLYYSTGVITDLSNWQYNIDDIIGDLKVRATVYDNLGASAFEEYAIANDCSDIMISFDNIDWTKSIKTINFETKTVKTLWKQEVKKIQWDMKTVSILWSNIPKKFNGLSSLRVLSLIIKFIQRYKYL